MAAAWAAVGVAVVGLVALAWGWVVRRPQRCAPGATPSATTTCCVTPRCAVPAAGRRALRADAVRRRDRRAAGPAGSGWPPCSCTPPPPRPTPRSPGLAPAEAARLRDRLAARGEARARDRRSDVQRPTRCPSWSSRLHPLTPLLRGWKIFAAAVAIAAPAGLRRHRDRLAARRDRAEHPDRRRSTASFSWRATRYRSTTTTCAWTPACSTKRSRQVRLDRLQAVDVVRPLVARVLGLAELRLEVAGGGVVRGAARLPVRGAPPSSCAPSCSPGPPACTTTPPRRPERGAGRGAAGAGWSRASSGRWR